MKEGRGGNERYNLEIGQQGPTRNAYTRRFQSKVYFKSEASFFTPFMVDPIASQGLGRWLVQWTNATDRWPSV